jgi:hypothetical protein
MKTLPVALATSAAVVFAPAVQACGGDSGGTECTCADPTVFIDLPASRAGDVVAVTLSGEGCATASATCTEDAASGCAQYAFRGTGIGACDVDVSMMGAPADYNEQVSFAQLTCCPGYYIEPPGASPIDVTGGLDAGAEG